VYPEKFFRMRVMGVVSCVVFEGTANGPSAGEMKMGIVDSMEETNEKHLVPCEHADWVA